jgi:hypothetical protein
MRYNSFVGKNSVIRQAKSKRKKNVKKVKKRHYEAGSNIKVNKMKYCHLQ